MRIRRHLRGKTRRGPRPGMKGDWLVLAIDQCGQEVHITNSCTGTGPQVEATQSFTLIDSADLTAKQDGLTVVRIVGEIVTFGYNTWITSDNLTVGAIIMNEGIYTSTTDGTGLDVRLDPGSPADGELDQWLWRRRFAIGMDTIGGVAKEQWGSNQDYAEGMNAHLDIRVKRKLKQGTSLIYTSTAIWSPWLHSQDMPQENQMFYRQFFNLRGYVKF